ncbi:trypsin-1-like isoform X2 [Arctopsyche grandis]|uniref:trypsin-1-like isoform X2 n=1 Tax=Arctopsyche grandis TaxID=121162 RepID=UPI00406D9A63
MRDLHQQSVECAHSAPQSKLMSPTIIGGQIARMEDFKYIASLRKYGMHHCGAAVLNTKWALTASHCFYDQEFDEYSLRTGSADLIENGEYYELEKFIIHENYDPNTLNNDVALVNVKKSMKFDEYTFPIPLPSLKFKILDGEMSTVAGWGYINEGGPVSMVLQMVRIPIMNQGKCSSMYSQYNNITDSMLCAGREEGQKDACQGDSGGPLAVRGVLAGVVSWGRGCARPNSPGVYADVQHFVDWIQEHINPIESMPVNHAQLLTITSMNATFIVQNL